MTGITFSKTFVFDIPNSENKKITFILSLSHATYNILICYLYDNINNVYGSGYEILSILGLYYNYEFLVVFFSSTYYINIVAKIIMYRLSQNVSLHATVCRYTSVHDFRSRRPGEWLCYIQNKHTYGYCCALCRLVNQCSYLGLYTNVYLYYIYNIYV